MGLEGKGEDKSTCGTDVERALSELLHKLKTVSYTFPHSPLTSKCCIMCKSCDKPPYGFRWEP